MSLYDFAAYVVVGTLIFRFTNFFINVTYGLVIGLIFRTWLIVLGALNLGKQLLLYVVDVIDRRRYPRGYRDDR